MTRPSRDSPRCVDSADPSTTRNDAIMIGVAASPKDLQIAEEFFELFKTPWERAVPSRKYQVVLSTDGNIGGLEAELFLIYNSAEQAFDRDAGIAVQQADGPVGIEWDDSTFPIYGRVAMFTLLAGAPLLKLRGQALDCPYRAGADAVRRIGYDLFREVLQLLTAGQPASQAAVPTLELHIALLRHLLLDSKIPFVEVLPRPDGFDFMCCLTHDVDFFGVRRHRFDRTLAGFIARASLGTFADLVRGRRPLTE